MSEPTSTNSDTPSVLAETAQGVLTLTLNRPEHMNAVRQSSLVSIDEALASITGGADGVRAVVLTGAGRAFCAGADLGAFAQAKAAAAHSPEALSAAQKEADALDLVYAHGLIESIVNAGVPIIAAVNGPAVGIGLSLALACDYVVMSESAYLMLGFSRIGLVPDGGSTMLVAASAGRHRALRMALTGEKVNAETALAWGLVSEVHADAAGRAQELASEWAQAAPLSLAHTKALINRSSMPDFAGALEREMAAQAQLQNSHDFTEGVTAFLEKRAATFLGR